MVRSWKEVTRLSSMLWWGERRELNSTCDLFATQTIEPRADVLVSDFCARDRWIDVQGQSRPYYVFENSWSSVNVTK